ncbi:hypothetical protein FKB34_01750 [Glycocaulis profundi]|nr:hypothetical protein FKB34_01750 [Glycocaulis profundi]
MTDTPDIPALQATRDCLTTLRAAARSFGTKVATARDSLSVTESDENPDDRALATLLRAAANMADNSAERHLTRRIDALDAQIAVAQAQADSEGEGED